MLTNNVWHSFLLMISLVLLVEFILNENSPFCLIPVSYREKEAFRNFRDVQYKKYCSNLHLCLSGGSNLDNFVDHKPIK
jgi:hypothetical protein